MIEVRNMTSKQAIDTWSNDSLLYAPILPTTIIGRQTIRQYTPESMLSFSRTVTEVNLALKKWNPKNLEYITFKN